MQDNPYLGMLEMIKGIADERIRPMTRQGVVTSITPLTVLTSGLSLGETDLLINASLGRSRSMTLSGATTGLTLKGGGSIQGDICERSSMSVSGGSLSGTAVISGNPVFSLPTGGRVEHPKWSLAVGDEVLLLSQDDQTFIILCKVVAV